MLGLLGKKLGMTQIFNDAGEPVQVTVVQAGPCKVVKVLSKDKEGYDGICVGFEPVKKEKNVRKPLAGFFKKAGIAPFQHLKEFRPNKMEGLEIGKDLTVELFKKGDIIDVSGVTKGRGFQGVIKRCGKKGGPMGHGSKFHRTTGSVGMRTWPGRVLPGTGMAGQMGNVKRTIKNIEVFGVDTERNLVFVRGAIPGGKNGLVVLSVKAM